MSSTATLQHRGTPPPRPGAPGCGWAVLAASALAALVAGAGCAHRAGPPITVVAGGDLQLGPGHDDPLAELAPHLVGDLRLANLESPLTAQGAEDGLDAAGRPTPGRPTRFAAPPERAAVLAARLDVVSLANNHADDQGEGGRADTLRALARAGTRAAQPERPLDLVIRGRRVSVLARAFAPDADLDGPEAAALVTAVRSAAREALVLVSLEWGHTGELLPTEAQRALAARLADAGARAVLGHGPHAPQGIERRGAAVIAYSLGNLAFACRCTEWRDAYLLRLTLAGASSDATMVPIEAGLGGAPARASRDPDLRVLLRNLSVDLGSTVEDGPTGLTIR